MRTRALIVDDEPIARRVAAARRGGAGGMRTRALIVEDEPIARGVAAEGRAPAGGGVGLENVRLWLYFEESGSAAGFLAAAVLSGGAAA